MKVRSCVLVAGRVPDADRDFLLAEVERRMAAGEASLPAQRAAAQALMDRIAAERAEVARQVLQREAAQAQGPELGSAGALNSIGPVRVFDAFRTRGGVGPGDVQTAAQQAASMLGIDWRGRLVPDETLPPATPAAVDVTTAAVHYNPAQRLTQAQWLQVMAEEMMHLVDLVEPQRTLSATSPRLAPTGDIMTEAQRSYDAGSSLSDWLHYPLGVAQQLGPARVQAELFARLAVLYHGDAALMRRSLPVAYEAYHAVFNVTPLGLNRSVRPALPGAGDQGGRALSVPAAAPDTGRGAQPERSGAGRAGPAGRAGDPAGPADQRLVALRRAFERTFEADPAGGLVLQPLQSPARGAMLAQDAQQQDGARLSRSVMNDFVRVARDSVLAWAKQRYAQPRTVQTKDGAQVIVAYSGLRHAMHDGAPTVAQLAMATRIEDLLRDATLLDTKPDNRGRSDPASTSRFVASFTLDGRPMRAILFVRNHSDGRRYYDHGAAEIEAPPGQQESGLGAQGAVPPTPPYGGVALSVRDLETLVGGQAGADSATPATAGGGAGGPTDSGASRPMRRQQPLPLGRGIRLAEFGRTGQTIEAVQDRYNRWKQVIDAAQAQGGMVTEANDFYRAEERYWGKVGARMEDFDREVQAFIEAVKADGLTLQQVQDYAYARHARERNAHLRTKRGNGADGFDSWSGMSDDDADAILQQAQLDGTAEKLARHQATLQRWIQGTRDLMLDEGLITDDQYGLLTGFYENYVPLRTTKTAEGNGTGSGFGGAKRAMGERARGRYSEAEDIIENILADRARTLVMAGKNEVMRSFLQFVLDNPEPTLWEISAVQSKVRITRDEQGNEVFVEELRPDKGEDTVVIMDGGREVRVKVKDPALLRQMKNLNVEGVSQVVGAMLMAQRALGRLYTSLNPVFTVINWARDVQTATFGMIQEQGFQAAGRMLLDIPAAMREAFNAERGRPSADYQQFRESGGKTGFMDFKDIETLSKDLQDRLRNAERSGADPRVWGPRALELVEAMNAVIENSTRYAAFRAAKQAGASPARAASISKNLTVNFNRKGTYTPQLSAFFLFFNPAVQGTVRIAQALRSPKVLATLGAAMGGVVALALQNAAMGEDDDGVPWWDKVPPEVKDRNLVILLPPEVLAGEALEGEAQRKVRYIKIPMPYGWNFFATVANTAVDVMRHAQDPAHGHSASRGAARLAASFLGAYMPVQEVGRSITGDPASLALAAVPDFANAIVQPLINLNSFGRPMYPERAGDEHTPDSQKFWPGQAGTAWQAETGWMNDVTGGDAYRSGWVDLTPATLENLVRAYGGGPASFILDTLNAVYMRQTIERPEAELRRLPFAKQLMGTIDAETDLMLGYERMDRIKATTDPLTRAMREGNYEAAERIEREAPEMARLGGALLTTRERLAEIRKAELAVISSDLSNDAKYARLVEISAAKRRALQDLNRAYNESAREYRTERNAEKASRAAQPEPATVR